MLDSSGGLRSTHFGDAFPEITIATNTLQCPDQRDANRLADEIRISEIEGHTWKEITLEQARATWDILELVSPTDLPAILPGYLQWLWDSKEADAMVSALPNLLIQVLNSNSNIFNFEQLEVLSRFMSTILDNNRIGYLEEEALLYADVIRLLDQLANEQR